MTQFLSGFCLGIAAVWAVLEVMAIAARRRDSSCPGAKILTEGDTHFLKPFVPARDADMRDVAQEAETQPQTWGVDYKFLGMTGEEQ